MAKGLDKAVPKTKYTEDSFELGHTQVTCWARVTINVPLAAGYALRPLISYGLSAQVWGSYAKLDVETGEVVWGYGCCQCTTRATPGGPACFAKRSTMFLGDATNISLADAAPAGLLKNKGEWIGGRADGETAELVARPHPASLFCLHAQGRSRVASRFRLAVRPRCVWRARHRHEGHRHEGTRIRHRHEGMLR